MIYLLTLKFPECTTLGTVTKWHKKRMVHRLDYPFYMLSSIVTAIRQGLHEQKVQICG